MNDNNPSLVPGTVAHHIRMLSLASARFSDILANDQKFVLATIEDDPDGNGDKLRVVASSDADLMEIHGRMGDMF